MIYRIFDPFFLARRALRREVASMANGISGTVLDVGCGIAPYREYFAHTRYFGVDRVHGSVFGSARTGADILFDGNHLPFADACIDAVLCSQVLEHVFEPRAFLAEIHRVLRPGGTLLLTVPFVWDEHEQPYDYARYSSFGLRHLASACGYDVQVARRTLADASLFSQLWLAYCHKVMRRSPLHPLLTQILIALASVTCNCVGLVIARIMPANPDLYLDNAMVLVKPRREEPSCPP